MTNDQDINERKTRQNIVKNLQQQGIDPYPSQYTRSHQIDEVLLLQLGTKNIKVAGRIMTIRIMGKLAFANLQDGSGTIQIAFKQDTLGKEEFKFIKNLNRGDFIGVSGKLFKTQKGELTIEVNKYKLLTKALRPLPEKWHGLKDQELRFRKRYLDLITNPETRKLFISRSKFIKNVRQYLDDKKFLEVEIPSLEAVPGGADAQPFITHHETLDIDLYLRISLELHLKRLMIGGFEKVFEIGKVFRNEGMSTQHLQEFTMLEFYSAYDDYNDLMKFVESFYVDIMKKTFGTLKCDFVGHKIDFKKPWEKVDYVQAIKKETGIDVVKASDEEIIDAIKKHNVKTDIKLGRGRLIDQLYKKVVRTKLIQPTFVINLPVSVSPLAKRSQENPDIAERMVVVVAGVEIGNGFSELNDPQDQKQRFEEQVKLRKAGDKEAQMMDEDFIEALEYGMPPTAGFGIGLDRLFMVMAGVDSIREVVLFPTMKEK
ncbi:lysine--tRNA ligase [Patescibacteria group bacterium]|nr:lysine--tRNA ligase [Patescibacteria group bacterium]